MRKPSIIFLLVCVFAMSLFSMSVNAAGNALTLTDVKLVDKSATASYEVFSFADNVLSSNISFDAPGDFIELALTLKNIKTTSYKIDSVKDNLSLDYLKSEYSYSGDSINEGAEMAINLKLTYTKRVLNVDSFNINDLTITVKLLSGSQEEETVVNPKTGDALIGNIVVFCISATLLVIIFIVSKNKKLKIAGVILVVLGVVALPTIIVAQELADVDIKLVNISLKGEFEAYTVTINPNNGTAPIERQVKYGDPLGELPSNPSKEGYNFREWQNKDGDTITKDTIIVRQDEITAVYDAISYTISYDLDGGSIATENRENYTIETESFELNNPAKQGYSFSGWTGSNGQTPQTRVTISKGMTGDLNYKANYEANNDTKYTVIHKYENLDGTYADETEILEGTTGAVVQPAFREKTGFVNPTAKTIVIDGNGEASIDYIYNRKTYVLTLNNAEYITTTAVSGNRYRFGEKLHLAPRSRDGYVFTGWSNGNTQAEIDYEMIDSNNEIGPIYRPVKFIVVFDKNSDDATGEMTGQEFTYDVEQKLTKSTFVFTEHALDSWNTQKDGSGTSYTDEQIVKNLAKDDNATVTLYAQWKENCDEPNSFATDSWNTIVCNVQKGNTSKYEVGDIKAINMPNFAGDHKLRIVNKTVDERCSEDSFSQTTCGFVLQFADTLYRQEYVSGDDAMLGWEGTLVRARVNVDAYNDFPEALRNAIIDTRVVSGHNSVTENNYVTTDKLYLLATNEVYGKRGINNVIANDSGEPFTRQLDYYREADVDTDNFLKAVEGMIGGRNYTMRFRSADTTARGNWYYAPGYSWWTGGSGYYYYPNGIAPAFRLYDKGAVAPNEVLIRYDANGGEPITKTKKVYLGSKLGKSPNAERDGYSHVGWSTEPDGSDTVDENTKPIANATYYAKWEKNDPMPVVWSHEGTCDFNGSGNITGDECTEYHGNSYIDTGIQLFSSGDDNYLKDFEVGFTVESRNSYTDRDTMFNTMDESESPWPGVVYRLNSDAEDQIGVNTNSSSRIKQQIRNENVHKVVIRRVDNKIALSLDGGSFQEISDMTDLVRTFDVNATFGASLNKYSEPQRYFDGSLSNMYIKLGEFED